MINCSFLPVFYEHHQSIKEGATPPAFKDFATIENIWLGFYGLGKFEAYQFLYAECTSLSHLQQWMLSLKVKRTFWLRQQLLTNGPNRRTASQTVEILKRPC